MAIGIRDRIAKAKSSRQLLMIRNVALDAAAQAEYVGWSALAKSFEADAKTAQQKATELIKERTNGNKAI